MHMDVLAEAYVYVNVYGNYIFNHGLHDLSLYIYVYMYI